MTTRVDVLAREVEALRSRLSRMAEVTARINASLEFETVLQGVLDSARSLAGARYGLIFMVNESGEIQDLLTSGLAPHEHEQFMALPAGPKLFAHLSQIPGPMLFDDFYRYTRSVGFPEFRLPLPVEAPVAVLTAPIRSQGESVGNIYLTGTETGGKFLPEDEETLVMFASQAAMVIANARRYREEQRARADLETLIDTSPVGVVVFDARAGRAVSLNREARRITSELHRPGASAEGLLEIIKFRRADGREVSLEELSLSAALSTGETVRLEEIVIQVPDGNSLTTLVNATPIRSPEGEVESVIVTLQDMTPLEEVAQLRAEFLGMVSHELRAPLAAIKGSAVTLLEAFADLDPAEVREFHRIINRQADHMRDLIGDLLDVARIQTGTLPIDPEPVTVALIVDEARSRFHSGGGRENLQIDLSADLPPVLVDRRRIVQVLDNLLSNAAKFSPQSSPIRLAAARHDFRVTISVSDEGRGVATDRLPRLFGKFSRVDGAGSEHDVGGSGLGLAICKGLVEAHGGRIWAESDGLGLGTRLSFTVPVAEEDDARAAHISTGQRSDEQDRPRILAVDDDPRALRYIRDILVEAGYAPVVTGDPDDVQRLIRASSPDAVLMDLMLPGSDGITLMQQILSLTDVPVIFLSAFAQEDVVARALDSGAVDYIVKPFSPTELAARIRVALRQRATRREAEPPRPYVFGDLTVNYDERCVTLAGHPVRLTTTEYKLLSELSSKAGRIVSHGQLLRQVWNLTASADLRPMRTAIKSLRRKLGDDANAPTYIFTETRVGYRMPQPPQRGTS